MDRARCGLARLDCRAQTHRAIAVTVLAFMCACAYKGRLPSIADDSAEVRRIGCLDITMHAEPDTAAQGPAVRLRFGNRCDTPVRIDLGAIVATARLSDGRAVHMRVYDPNSVIRPGVLDARRTGWEVLEYHFNNDQHDGQAAQQRVEVLCLDLALMLDNRSAKRGAPARQESIACIPMHATDQGGGGES